jgi:SAM-dependent methyltransferase
MEIEEIKRKKQEIAEHFGPWTAHCIHLGSQIYTFEESQMDSRLRRFLQIASDITGEPLEMLRVLDLACLEGHYSIEFALHGANVLAIEGREANLAKARFVKEALSLNNLELALDDVRKLDQDRHGVFDVVLCLGILYHLDTPDVMDFVEKISTVCQRVTIIDTHISLSDEASYTWKGKTYWGRYAQEHRADATPDEKARLLWFSLDNPTSFRFTRASLCNLLRRVGFTSVYECLNPYEYHNPNWPRVRKAEKYAVWKDRITLVAIKGRNQTLLSSPITEASPEIDRPEKSQYLVGHKLMPGELRREMPRSLRSITGRLLPRQVKTVLKKLIR